MLVVDTSVAIKWVVPEDENEQEAGTTQALSLLSESLIAPDLLAIEFANALWKKHKKQQVAHAQALEALQILPDIVRLQPSGLYLEAAFHMSVALGHPVYDCIFLACAAAHDLEFITADEKLVQRVTGRSYSPRVTCLSDWRAALES